ncbi:MAG: Crp/Fnr family transcriptional regulator [Candidatus Eremiobacteraeota bacterium]|nr:Crp/Fnr family transcriptional regulator [Candidatus Eremiobacteraeota bacterium]
MPTFFDLSNDTITALARVAQVRTLKKDERLATPERVWPFIGILQQGLLGLYSADGRELQRLLFLVQRNELFGVVPFFKSEFANGNITVLSSDATFLQITHEAVHAIAQDRPELMYSLGVACAQRVEKLASALQAQTFRPVIDRVAQSLLPYASQASGLSPCDPTLVRMTQSHIASAAGTVKEVVARAIAELETGGALRRERGHICELNRTRLLEFIDA